MARRRTVRKTAGVRAGHREARLKHNATIAHNERLARALTKGSSTGTTKGAAKLTRHRKAANRKAKISKRGRTPKFWSLDVTDWLIRNITKGRHRR